MHKTRTWCSSLAIQCARNDTIFTPGCMCNHALADPTCQLAAGRSRRRSNMPAMPSDGDAAVCWRGSGMCVSKRLMHSVCGRQPATPRQCSVRQHPPHSRNSSLAADSSTVQATEPEPRLPSQTITHQPSKSTASVQQVNSCGPPTQHSQPSKRFAYGAVHKRRIATVREANGGSTYIHLRQA